MALTFKNQKQISGLILICGAAQHALETDTLPEWICSKRLRKALKKAEKKVDAFIGGAVLPVPASVLAECGKIEGARIECISLNKAGLIGGKEKINRRRKAEKKHKERAENE